MPTVHAQPVADATLNHFVDPDSWERIGTQIDPNVRENEAMTDRQETKGKGTRSGNVGAHDPKKQRAKIPPPPTNISSQKTAIFANSPAGAYDSPVSSVEAGTYRLS
jgi:hypothetical protein